MNNKTIAELIENIDNDNFKIIKNKLKTLINMNLIIRSLEDLRLLTYRKLELSTLSLDMAIDNLKKKALAQQDTFKELVSNELSSLGVATEEIDMWWEGLINSPKNKDIIKKDTAMVFSLINESKFQEAGDLIQNIRERVGYDTPTIIKAKTLIASQGSI